MSVVVAAIAVFPVLTVLMIALSRAENLVSSLMITRSPATAEIPTPAPASGTDSAVS
ncbi:hypothetical protein KIH74_20825 [Kineosporia sp. J2-2]|uniref:Uncharacterized protein n=1 Tax=Kineosporia corallincola TaxID=2835133 RepID=A0ABS5TJW2_9ACTN|nr:hypothetical protein [Kineosporia corallincola]MBT0771394.1 hypothetical protein [Kineosporia corallincola]